LSDAVIYYRGYHRTNRRPPALLAVEVLSFFKSPKYRAGSFAERGIYAALEVPAYWIIDRRDQSVLAHTEPHDDGTLYARSSRVIRSCPRPAWIFCGSRLRRFLKKSDSASLIVLLARTLPSLQH